MLKSKSKIRQTSKNTKSKDLLVKTIEALPIPGAILENKNGSWDVLYYNNFLNEYFGTIPTIELIQNLIDNEEEIVKVIEDEKHKIVFIKLISQNNINEKTINKLTKNESLENSQAKDDDLKNQIISLVSHELNTPLVSILNSLTMLNDKSAPLSEEELGSLTEIALRNSQNLHHNITTLLELAESQDGRFSARLYDIEPSALINSLKHKIIHLSKEFNVNVNFHIEEALPNILGNSLKLEKAFSYIFNEVLKHTEKESNLIFVTNYISEKKASFIEFQIEVEKAIFDFKGGLDLESLFTIFGQKDNVLTRREQGIGTELYIAKEIIRLHKGHLITEKTETGFLIKIRLPLLESEEALKQALESRIFAKKHELGTTSLVMIKPIVQEGKDELDFIRTVIAATRQAIYRTTDTVYHLEKTGEIALLMDDCKKNDAIKVTYRVIEGIYSYLLSKYKGTEILAGLAACPEDGINPKELINIARNYSNVSQALITRD